jgi:hypothetical protein
MPSATRSSMTGPAGAGASPGAAIVHVRAIPQIEPKGRWTKAAKGRRPDIPEDARRPRAALRGGKRDKATTLAAGSWGEDSRTPGHRPRQPRPPQAEGPWPEREPCTVFTYPSGFVLGKVLARRGPVGAPDNGNIGPRAPRRRSRPVTDG